jgi:fructan beta-fructosidase
LYREKDRPGFHFTARRGWLNDPNGLVYSRGEYHLFYQHNPYGWDWGNMHWGHAVSPDLVHWQELPVALKEENGVMIFSGSAVVDEHNSSGLCSNDAGNSCLIAIYTGHTPKRQSQNIAFSNDRGRTWTKYRGNPVIDLGMKDFRDPKVFWHDASRKWVMVVALPKMNKVRFFTSTDLKRWTPAGDFGPAGQTAGDWECPDLFALPIDGQPGRSRWVLSVNINPGAMYGGSGNQYFIGSFDGIRFTNENPPSRVLWADFGKDFYASQSYNGVPPSDGRRIWIGWFSNWQYAREEPTTPWRCIQSIPRVLKLAPMANGDVRLMQEPIAELRRLRESPIHVENTDAAAANRALRDFRSTSYEIEAEFDAGAEIRLQLRKGPAAATIVGYSPASRELFIDRTRSGNTGFSRDFPGRHSGPLTPRAGRVHVHIFVDRSSIEVFGGDGETVLSDRIFPGPDDNRVQVETAKVISLDVWPLKSAWPH